MGATTVNVNATTGAAQFNGGVTQSYAGIVQRATPVAFGVVDPSGLSLNGSTNNVAFSSWDAANQRYDIPVTGETYTVTGYSTVVTPLDNGSAVIPSVGAASGHLTVTLRNLAGNRVQGQFNFVVYKP